jgi:hypothetical protein
LNPSQPPWLSRLWTSSPQLRILIRVLARHRTAAASAFRTHGKSSRVNKKQVIGYFTADLSRTLRQIALDEGTSLQALIGEAVDLSRKRAVYARLASARGYAACLIDGPANFAPR